ncbi:MAG: hypothetical protein FD146_2036 [Anaerolineaceae bacterium]|nr:MAG: hypothetical protein FD146_2036 [Anaerolineaceae bacterium]
MDGSIYDRLQKKLEVQKEAEGISAGDIAQLPPALRKIMRLMLREVELTHAAICATMSTLPMADQLNRAELDQALDTLTAQNWLIRRGEGERLNYTVNLRRKPPSQLGGSFWNALDAKITESKKANPT